MSQTVVQSTQLPDSTELPAQPQTQPETKPLERTLDEIRRDSEMHADEYLNETVAPGGGE